MIGARSEFDDIDSAVDNEIAKCLNPTNLRSFFLFAGAGSGKTRSLVTALKFIQSNLRETLKVRGQRVGVITFTNAAADEIKRRLLFDPTIDVRTIHSFAWSLVGGLNRDIREWLRSQLREDIQQLQVEEAKGRKGTKASATRLRKIESKQIRLQRLDNIKRFVYSPTGDNRERDALNHFEVLQLTSDFLKSKRTMQSILVGRHPILLVDESQDTNKNLVDALFAIQAAQKDRFVLGLFGDMMQRIYNDGRDGLGQDLPSDWATPGKTLNHRCPKRIVTLINKVRSTVDNHQQQARPDAIEGSLRLFLLPSDTKDKQAAERAIALAMAQATSDNKWNDPKLIKTLTLEHRMAAARIGFLDMFIPLYEVESWRTSLLEGTQPMVRFFTKEVLPLVRAKQAKDRFAIARICKALSPLLTADLLRTAENKGQHLRNVIAATDELVALWEGDVDPSLLQVLHCVARTRLLAIPEILEPHASPQPASERVGSTDGSDEPDAETERTAAIEKFLEAPFSQVEPFATYMAGEAHFDTHQGVKGLEFDRVMVIMDDGDARGFSFKYEDLFGGKAAGERTVEATRRLFYVTCSRARQSLALVAYTSAVDRVRGFVLSEGWFTEEEVVTGIPK